MSKKKKKSGANRRKTDTAPTQQTSATQEGSAPKQQPPKWGILVAAFLAFFIVSVAIIVMDKVQIVSPMLRTGIVIVLAIAAGLGARPLTLALQKKSNR